MDSPEFIRLRKNMVKTYVLDRGISDTALLRIIEKVPRHSFVDEALWLRAYGDYALPIGERQTISQPHTIALTTQALGLHGGEKILEIGTGSGYQTAILAEFADHVYSIEKLPVLARRARKILDSLGYLNIVIRIMDGTYGLREEAPFDAILVSAASPMTPKVLLDQLKDDGRLVMPFVDEKGQQLVLFKKGEKGLSRQVLGPCRFVPLVGLAERAL